MTNIYQRLREFAERLTMAGFSIWGSRMIDAIESGSMSGEIFMAARWNIRELLRLEKTLPQEIRELGERLIQEINATGA